MMEQVLNATLLLIAEGPGALSAPRLASEQDASPYCLNCMLKPTKICHFG